MSRKFKREPYDAFNLLPEGECKVIRLRANGRMASYIWDKTFKIGSLSIWGKGVDAHATVRKPYSYRDVREWTRKQEKLKCSVNG